MKQFFFLSDTLSPDFHCISLFLYEKYEKNTLYSAKKEGDLYIYKSIYLSIDLSGLLPKSVDGNDRRKTS